MSRAEQRTVLEAFSRTLNQEAHNLKQWPELLWQQMYNRLQWEDGDTGGGIVTEVIKTEFERRSKPGVKLWLHNICPLQESGELLMVIDTNTDTVLNVYKNDENQTVVAACKNWKKPTKEQNYLILFDLSNGRELQRTNGPIGINSYCGSISQDGAIIAWGYHDGVITLLSIDTGNEILRLKSSDKPITCCDFSPDGRQIIFGGRDGILRLCDLDSKKEIMTFDCHQGFLHFCAFSPDGTRIVSAGSDCTAKIYDARTGKQITDCSGHVDQVNCCAFSPDGTLVVSASDDRSLKLWDANSGQEIKTFTGHSKAVLSCAFSEKGDLLISGGEDKTVRIWNVGKGKESACLLGHTDDVLFCRPHKSRSLLSGGGDGTIRLWTITHEKERVARQYSDRPITCCAFSYDGKLVVSGSGDSFFTRISEQKATMLMEDRAILWDAETGKILISSANNLPPLSSCAFHPLFPLVALGAKGKNVILWDIKDNSTTTVFSDMPQTSEIDVVLFSPKGDIMIWNDVGTIKMFNLGTGREGSLVTCPFIVRTCSFSADGRFLAVGGTPIEAGHESLLVWDFERERSRTLDNLLAQVFTCAISPGGEYLVAADEQKIKLWNVFDGKEIENSFYHESAITCCVFSGDGQSIISVGLDRLVKIWSVYTGEEVVCLPSIGDPECLAVSPVCSSISFGDSGGNLYLLRLRGANR